jgi:hypothetical protein
MKRLLINGDVGIKIGSRIEYQGQNFICFSVTRNGDYHGPRRVQISCIVGESEEYSIFINEEYTPHFLETLATECEEIKIVG